MRKARSSDETIRVQDNVPDAAELQSMSNAELLEEIERLISAEPDAMDTDRLERCLALLQERAPVMENFEPEDKWSEFTNKHALLFAEEESEDGNEDQSQMKTSGSRKPRAGRMLKRLSAGLAAALTLVVTATAFGANPIQAVINWADDIISVYTDPSGVMELPEDADTQYRTLEEALETAGIDSLHCPKWIPADYRLVEVSELSFGKIVRCSALYEADRGEFLISITQTDDTALSLSIEKEPGGYTYQFNGVEYYIVSDLERSKAGWQYSGCSYSISGDVSEQEIIRIIESIPH